MHGKESKNYGKQSLTKKELRKTVARHFESVNLFFDTVKLNVSEWTKV